MEELHLTTKDIQSNWIFLSALGIDCPERPSNAGTGFSFMAITCVLMGLLVLLAAGLVIYNILKIAVSKRILQYGMLRAIEAQRRQLYHLVSRQLFFFVRLVFLLASFWER